MNSHHLSLSSKFCLQSCVWEYWEGVCVKKQNYHLCLWWFHSNPCLVWTCNLHCRQIVGRRIIGIGFRNNPCLSWLCSVKLLSIPAPREVISLTCIPVLSLSAGWCAGMLWRTARNLILKCFGFFTCCFVPLSVRRVLTFLALSLAGRACSIQWLWYSICCTPYSLVTDGNPSLWPSQMLLLEMFVSFSLPKHVSPFWPAHWWLQSWMGWYGGWREQCKTVSSGHCAVYSDLNFLRDYTGSL